MEEMPEGQSLPADQVFRGRRLTPETDIYSFNTWDDVVWDDARASAVAETIRAQTATCSLSPAADSSRTAAVMGAAGELWDRFYRHHSRWFFKDRRWLPSEFPELFAASAVCPRVVWEVGCGPGNTLFPLLAHHKRAGNAGFFIHACDISQEAVALVKAFRDYDPAKIDAFVWDGNSAELPPSIRTNSVDAITCIFVLSALDPSRLPHLFRTFSEALRPGGHVLIRDYAWGDLAQTRLRPERVVTSDGSLYVRGDGTAVHFFSEDEFKGLADASGLRVAMNYTDRRLIVNRKRRVEMWRCWIQVKMYKAAE